MNAIKGLVEKIRDEVEDVEKYAEAAAHAKLDDPMLANIYIELAGEEVKHADRLHKAAVDLIAKHTASGKEVPHVMKTIWEFEHKNIIEDMANAKRILEMSRM